METFNMRLTKLTQVFNAQAADTVTEVKTKHYDFMIITVATAALTDGTFKIRGTVDPAVDLTAVQSASNIWDHLYSYNLDSAAGTAGNTGYTLGASAYAQLKVNVDGMNKIALEITGRTAGSYTAYVYGVTTRGK